jgi:DNA-directed RNA polymerase subunit RPC12/RpoP
MESLLPLTATLVTTMRCPNCHNKIEDDGVLIQSIPINPKKKWYHHARDKFLCSFCHAELELDSKWTWQNRISKYFILLPLAGLAFFPHLMQENRWLWLLMISLWIAMHVVGKKTQKYKVRIKTDDA